MFIVALWQPQSVSYSTMVHLYHGILLSKRNMHYYGGLYWGSKIIFKAILYRVLFIKLVWEDKTINTKKTSNCQGLRTGSRGQEVNEVIKEQHRDPSVDVFCVSIVLVSTPGWYHIIHAFLHYLKIKDCTTWAEYPVYG